MKNDDYIIDILERVKAIEVILRDYEELEENTEDAKLMASRARESVKEIREKLEFDKTNKLKNVMWTKRTILAALLALLFNIIFTILKMKFGW